LRVPYLHLLSAWDAGCVYLWMLAGTLFASALRLIITGAYLTMKPAQQRKAS
jgi:hypothetical protein